MQVLLQRTCWLASVSIAGAAWLQTYAENFKAWQREVIWAQEGVRMLELLKNNLQEPCPGIWKDNCLEISDISRFKQVSKVASGLLAKLCCVILMYGLQYLTLPLDHGFLSTCMVMQIVSWDGRLDEVIPMMLPPTDTAKCRFLRHHSDHWR